MAPPSRLAKARVLDAACELFVRDGAAGFSLRRVAGELGVTPMALYRHVKSKDELLEGVLARGFEEFGAYLARSEQGTTGLEKLRLASNGFFLIRARKRRLLRADVSRRPIAWRAQAT